MSTTYTPSPWWWIRMDGDKRNPLWVLTNATGDVVLTIKDKEFGPTAHPVADRQLIAAAPELLATLKEVLAHLRSITLDPGDDDDAPALVAAEALVAKAEGRDP